MTINESPPDGNKRARSDAFCTPDLSSPPARRTLGNIPEGMFEEDGTENLGKAMKREVMVSASTSSREPRQPITLSLSSDDDDEFDLAGNIGNNFISRSNSSRVTTTNLIYGYQYKCPYVVTAHMAKNGVFTEDKVYDKEFVTNLFTSIKKRDEAGPDGWKDSSLLCNQLEIHSVKLMRDVKNPRENRAKTYRFTNGGTGYYNVFVQVFSKKQVRDGLNSEEEMGKWLENIRVAFCATKAKFEFRLQIGGLCGRSESSYRPLDFLLLDGDVADYAKLFYRKKIEDGTLLMDPKRVAQFFAVWNADAARDLLG